MDYPTISLIQLDQLLDEKTEIQLIDLRNSASFQKYHIKGAINIPFRELEYSINKLDPNQRIVLYCSRGGQSMLASNRLSALGYQVINVANGLNNYRGKYLVRA